MARGDSIDDTRETPATDTVEAVPLGKRVRQLATQLGPARLIATVVFLCLAVVVARFGWALPLTNAAERALYDARATAMAPYVGQDKRIVLITYNHETLLNTSIRPPPDRPTPRPAPPHPHPLRD